MKLLRMIQVHNQIDQDIHIINNTYSLALFIRNKRLNQEDGADMVATYLPRWRQFLTQVASALALIVKINSSAVRD